MWKLLRAFLLVRVVEVIVVTGIFVVGSALETSLSKPYASKVNLLDALSAAPMVVAWYYIGFGYLIVGVAAATVWWFRGRSKSANSFMRLNTGVFVAHSIVVILVVYFGLHGSLAITLWVVWLSVIAFNLWFPRLVWRRLSPGLSE
jgi:hypothetical protein